VLYFVAMGKRRKERDYAAISTIILVASLLFLKGIGDLIILVGKFSIRLVVFFYKTICSLFSKIKLGVNRRVQQLSQLFRIKKRKPRPKRPEAVIYKRTIWYYLKNKLSKLSKRLALLFPRPKFARPKIPRLPSLRLFFIKLKYFFLGAIVVATIVGVYQINLLVKSLPNPALLTLRDIPTTTKIYDREGQLLYEIYADENRTPVKLAQIPEIVKQSTISIEDREFYLHQGFSLRGIVRALINNFNSRTLQGGSTITQQLVRSALLTPEKTLSRKIKEFLLSIWTEQKYTKDQILEMYLNQVPYGGTAWGIEAAAQTYFGKKVSDLTIAEAALLAGLPAAPTLYSPFGIHPELAKVRQTDVLNKLVENGFISKENAEKAKTEPLNFRKQRVPITAPHFVMYVKDLLEQQYGPMIVERGGLRVTTTLDLKLQEAGEKIVSNEIEKLQKLNVGNGAALITDPKNGEILAMVGSQDYFDKEKEGNVNLTTSLRQPGSSIKVVNYAKALQLGYTAASILDDSPITYRTPGLPPYSPMNYDGKYHGKIPLRVALASSYNVPAVKVLYSVGVKNMIEQGKLMGITTWDAENRFGLSLTLGGGDVTMLDMAKVYGTLSNEGKRIDLTPFVKITNYRGETLPLPIIQDEVQAVPSGVAFILTSILSDNAARSPAFGPNSQLLIPGKTVAVKTGTSDNKRDNWTIGYTPDYVVVVWVGNNNNSPMNPNLTSGITGAAPIWHEIMENITAGRPDKVYTIPSDVTTLPCYGRIEYFIRGTEPKGGCVLPPTNTPEPTKQP